MTVNREKLYDEVWAEPMTTVALRYDVSSNFLARVCERLKVPRPPRGYWPQVKVGKKNPRPPLPPAEPGDDLEWVRDGSVPARQPVVALPRGRRPKMVRADRPARHPLLVGVREYFDAARVSTYDDEKYAKPYKRNVVDVYVSKEVVKRALDAANDLFLALEDRGHRVVLGPVDQNYSRVAPRHREGEKEQQDRYYYGGWRGPARLTLVFVGEVAFGLTVFEISEEIEMRYDLALHDYVRIPPAGPKERPAPVRPGEWTTRKWLCSGRLGIHAYFPDRAVRWEEHWREQVQGDLPKLFDAVAKELEDAAPRVIKLKAEAEREAEERRKQWEAERLKEEKQEAEERRLEEEEQRLVELKQQLEDWRFARDARALVAELQELVASRGLRITVGGPVEQWLDWVLRKAAEADPLAVQRHHVDEMAREFGTLDRRRSPLAARLRLRRARRDR